MITVLIIKWKVYMKANALSNYADELSKLFVDAAFEFSKVLSGQAVHKSRGKIIVNNADRMPGRALRQWHVKKYFPKAAKKRVLELVNKPQPEGSMYLRGGKRICIW